MSFISGTVSGIENANAQEHAADVNRQNAVDTNAANYRLFQQSRGSTGSAILPVYDKVAEGKLAANATDAYTQAFNSLTPEQQAAASMAILAAMQPMVEGGNKAASGIFNGEMQGEQLASQAGVAGARQSGVTTNKQASMQSLAQTLNEISTIQAGKGYTGDSLAQTMVRSNMARANATGNAAMQSNVNMQNAQDVHNIKMASIQTKLNNLNLPYQLAKNQMDLVSEPSNNLSRTEQNRQGVFSMFNIGPHAFQNQNMPTVEPIASPFQIATQMQSAVGSAAANAAMQKWINSPSNVNAGSSAAGAYYGGAGAAAADHAAVQAAPQIAGSSGAAADYAALA